MIILDLLDESIVLLSLSYHHQSQAASSWIWMPSIQIHMFYLNPQLLYFYRINDVHSMPMTMEMIKLCTFCSVTIPNALFFIIKSVLKWHIFHLIYVWPFIFFVIIVMEDIRWQFRICPSQIAYYLVWLGIWTHRAQL